MSWQWPVAALVCLGSWQTLAGSPSLDGPTALPEAEAESLRHTPAAGQSEAVAWLDGRSDQSLSDQPAAENSAPQRPAYKSLRYDENYSFLADPANRTDWLDWLKYVPVGEAEGRYLSLGGELRERYEFFHNENFGAAPSDSKGNNDWLLQRYLLHGDLHVNRSLRVFGQLMSGFEEGRIGGPRPDIDANTFDAHQGFFDWTRDPGAEYSATWRLGRQEFDYGSGRLISAREAPNLRRSFDAVRLLYHANEWQVDGFWSRPVRNRPNVFDDDPNPLKSLWGVYSVGPLPALPGGHADLYYLGFENKQGTYFQGTAYELRHTLGTRIWGQPMPWEYNFELIWQFGTFGAGNIQAWAVASDTHYNFSDAPLRPRLGLTADITSGDHDPRTANLQTYNPLFPTGAYFNLADLGGPSNFIQLHPRLDLHFGEQVKASLDWGFFWRESLNDALYSIAVTPLKPGQPSRARYNGSSPAATLTWEPTRHLTMLVSYVHFFAGPFVQQNPPGEDVDYVTTWVTYKF